MKNISNTKKICEQLCINEKNGLFYTAENLWGIECNFPNRIKRLIKNTLKPDAFFVFNNKPLVLFYESPKDNENLHKAIWNFNESPIAIFSYDDKVEIFNGFKYLKDKSSLEELTGKDTLNDFNYFKLVSGKTWEKYEKELKAENRVDYKLLYNIKSAREILVNSNELEDSIANALIGKIIFVRYLIDRKVKIDFENKLETWTNESFCEILEDKSTTVRFFKYLETKFNGDMFFLNNEEYELIKQNDLNILIELLNEEVLENGQQSLFHLYDFAIIPIEFISNVYEYFIGDQKKNSSYFTPLFLVDYILSETIENYFSQNPNQYNCRVLDPACGSGVFLVESLRKIIEKYLALHPDVDKNSDKFKNVLKLLLTNNIFGIDKDHSAIQIAIFSLQLTLLDYQEPASIESFKFPKLLGNNFFVADFFDVDHEFNKYLQHSPVNFIIGNPPWKRGSKEKKAKFLEYFKDRKKLEKQKNNSKDLVQIDISNKEIAQAFLFRVSDFPVSNFVSFIVTSKVLYNKAGIKFRKYFLDNYKIQKVFELAPVRREIFNKSNDSAIAPAAIITYKSALGKDNRNNIIQHVSLKPSRFFSLFKIFTLYRSDFQEVQQAKLIEFDWLWKTLVYGSYLDFNLLYRLNVESQETTVIKTLIERNNLLKGKGVIVNGADDNDARHLRGYPFLDFRNSKNSIKSYCIYIDYTSQWSFDTVHRPRNPELFKSPVLLVKKGISNNFEITSVVSKKDIVYTDAITGIKVASYSYDLNYLYTISCFLNSTFASYFILHTSSSAGIEREQFHDIEKWDIPFVYDKEFTKLYEDIESLLKQKYSEDAILENPNLENKVLKIKNKIDAKILDLLHFNKMERSLLDYAVNVTIPVQMRHAGYEKHLEPFDSKDRTLESYAKLFLDRFSHTLNNKKQKFVVEILHSNYIIGMLFKVIQSEQYTDDIVWVDYRQNDAEILNMAVGLSTKRITDKLFVQKDIRGFEEDYFYVFKPNEKRLWHEAIAYQDVNEFMDAILSTNRRSDSV